MQEVSLFLISHAVKTDIPGSFQSEITVPTILMHEYTKEHVVFSVFRKTYVTVPIFFLIDPPSSSQSACALGQCPGFSYITNFITTNFPKPHRILIFFHIQIPVMYSHFPYRFLLQKVHTHHAPSSLTDVGVTCWILSIPQHL